MNGTRAARSAERTEVARVPVGTVNRMLATASQHQCDLLRQQDSGRRSQPMTDQQINLVIEAVTRQRNRYEKESLTFMRENKPEPENTRQGRIELAKAARELEKERN